MLSNQFWYGFIIGVGLVFLVFLISTLIARARAKRGGDS